MSMDKPNQPYPNFPTNTPQFMPPLLPDPSIRAKSFDDLLNNRGIRFIHTKAVPCPNILSTDNNAHHPNCIHCDDNGYIYYDEKEVWGIFQGNSLEKTFEAHGVWEVGTAVITFPTTYPDGTQCDFNTFDKLEVPDFTVRMWELKEYEDRDGGQQLRYPIQKVEFASSITNNIQKIYQPGVDFNISTDGKIVWISGQQPQEGEVITWAYFAHPTYIVLQSLRELRITQELIDGQKQAQRLPQQVLVRRDFMIGLGEKQAP